jgi:hypothetical protein
MGPKKGKKGGGKGKGKKGKKSPEDEIPGLQAFNLEQREVLKNLFFRMEELRERNDELKDKKN